MDFTKPLKLKVYEVLRNKILGGEFSPRQIYSETKLSKELGISRTPLRDAIHKLSQEGYIDVIPSKGFQLHELTERDAWETYQLRCALEVYCVSQIARNVNSDNAKGFFEKMTKLVDAQAAIAGKENTAIGFSQLDTEFHRSIVYYLDNNVMKEIFDQHLYHVETQITNSLMQEQHVEPIVEEHREILEAMKNGEVQRGCHAILEHLENHAKMFAIG